MNQASDPKIADVMRPCPAVIPMSATVQEAASRMSQENSGWLPVGGPTGPVGVVSAGDIVRRKAAVGGPLSATRVSEVMTLGVVCCRSSDSVLSALHLMNRHGVYQVGVIDEKGRLSAVAKAFDLFGSILTPGTAGG